MADLLQAWGQQLKLLFGVDGFRPNQVPIIQHVLAGKSALIIMATGGGKSLCFQFPASQRDGVTVVFSPLISLMVDQERALGKTGVPALAINSFLPYQETNRRIREAIAGNVKLLYIAPERLQNPTFMAAIRQINVALIAVDEAHCVSEWGHNFRPDYRRIAMFREFVGNPPVVALTATATPVVRDDIIKQLRLADAKTFHSTCNRDNIFMEVRYASDEEQRVSEIIKAIKAVTGGSIIIYVTSRADTGEVARAIEQQTGVKALPYHAQISAEERRDVHAAFMADKVRVVVATTAFGMGIDKPDVRLVAHAGLPGSLEAYYQEIGRAGRDGKPAKSLLVYTANDFDARKYLLEKNQIGRAEVEGVWRPIQAIQPGAMTEVGANAHQKAILVELEWQGAIRRHRSGPGSVAVERIAVTDENRLLQEVVAHFARRYRYDIGRFQTLREFLTTKGCRRAFILTYFGEEPVTQERCCDVCVRIRRAAINRGAPVQPRLLGPQPVTAPPARTEKPYVGPVSPFPASRDLAESHEIVRDGQRLWFVPLTRDPRAVLLFDPANLGGLTFRFCEVEYRGLLSSNANALRAATGVDLTGQPRG